MKNIVVVGAGGFGTEAIWVLEEMNRSSGKVWNILGYVDDDRRKKDQIYYDYRNLGIPEEVAESLKQQEIWYYCAIGDNSVRMKVVERLDNLGWHPAILIHPSVIFARNISIGEGTYIGAGSVICPNAVIGRHVLINTRAAIGHDAVIADFSQICPGGQINGACKVGRGALVGSNASILPGKSVGDGAIVGGNAQVVRSVKPGSTVNGVPAVTLKTV